MNKNKITQNQYKFSIISTMIAVGVLSMSSGLCQKAQQNGWIPIFFAGLYPIFIFVTAGIIDNKTNHASFWDISNKIYGKILSHIFLFIFFVYFLTLFSSVVSGFVSVLRQTISTFLKPIYIIVPTLIVVTCISICGIYMVGRICEFYFYLTLPLLIIPLFMITKGSIVNIKPIYFSFYEILKATPNSIYAFAGCEVSYFIISRISNKGNTIKSGIMATFITIFIYVFIVFMSIYYLGWELTSKLEYPLLYMIQSIEISIISNFMSIFIFLWSAIILRNLVLSSFVITNILSKMFKIDYRKSNYIFLPIVLVYIFFMSPEYNRKELLDILIPYFISFSFVWGLITTMLVCIKFRGEKK